MWISVHYIYIIQRAIQIFPQGFTSRWATNKYLKFRNPWSSESSKSAIWLENLTLKRTYRWSLTRAMSGDEGNCNINIQSSPDRCSSICEADKTVAQAWVEILYTFPVSIRQYSNQNALNLWIGMQPLTWRLKWKAKVSTGIIGPWYAVIDHPSNL